MTLTFGTPSTKTGLSLPLARGGRERKSLEQRSCLRWRLPRAPPMVKAIKARMKTNNEANVTAFDRRSHLQDMSGDVRYEEVVMIPDGDRRVSSCAFVRREASKGLETSFGDQHRGRDLKKIAMISIEKKIILLHGKCPHGQVPLLDKCSVTQRTTRERRRSLKSAGFRLK